MFGIEKHKVLIWSVTISLLTLFSCQSDKHPESVIGKEIHGETQGTTYTVILAEEGQPITKQQLDSIFTVFDLSLSTYVEDATISKINKATKDIALVDENHFYEECYNLSQHVYQLTSGAFDPSVFPLVKGWGFMHHMDSPLSQQEVDSILTFVSFEKNKLHTISFSNDSIYFQKMHPNFMIDFNAIAQGQSVDVVCAYLSELGYDNYYVEVGGELKTKGVNREGIPWRIGIDVPKENLSSREIENVLSISDKAVATSGNYRKFYIKDGVKYAHSLNPKTGFPVTHSMLSVTVIADNCALADAYATSFMIMGKEKTLEFVKTHPEEKLEVYILSAGKNDAINRDMSSGFKQFIAAN